MAEITQGLCRSFSNAMALEVLLALGKQLRSFWLRNCLHMHRTIKSGLHHLRSAAGIDILLVVPSSASAVRFVQAPLSQVAVDSFEHH